MRMMCYSVMTQAYSEKERFVASSPYWSLQSFQSVIIQVFMEGRWQSNKTVRNQNEYEKGGLKMLDLECLMKSLRLACLKRIFGSF